MDHFADRLAAVCEAKGSRVCVGLDPDLESLPGDLQKAAMSGPEEACAAVRQFLGQILDEVQAWVVAVKPQAAFFEALGPEGWRLLWDVVAQCRAAGLIVILDAKRGDIGSTARAYAEAFFSPPPGIAPVHAVTVNGYLGSDGVRPFVDVASECGGGVYVLAKTSNPSSGELQDLVVHSPGGERTVYQHMGHLIAEWGRNLVGACGYSSVGAVVGGTYPKQLAELRAELPTVPFLVPGYGAQGAGAEDVRPAFDPRGLGAIVNSSRAIIFAYSREPYRSRFGDQRYAEAAGAAARDMRDQINAALGV